ncbi:MAG: alpha/beta fold hydrolase [Salinisphaeraceae bacterium]|nr:alpha/beta fold hydrolase [Salinisphaeraceae bacterium]
MKSIPLFLKLAACLMWLSGCAAIFQPKTTAPITFNSYGNTKDPKHICILLPGIRDRIGVFEKYGFIDIAQPVLAQNPGTALITVDAHWGYYRQRSIVKRLTKDIISQYPEAKISFVGASLGGFGSLLMAMENPDRVENIVLLAPFLGEDDYSYLQRLRNQGPIALAEDEDLTLALSRVWQFLLDPQRKIPITIGYGTQDTFAPYYGFLMSQQAPLLHIQSTQGGHDWATWRKLWSRYARLTLVDPK